MSDLVRVGRPPSGRLRIGFIGCGGFASGTIWPCLRYAPIETAYACARHIDRAERNRRTFGAERVTTDVSEVIGDDSVAAVFVIGSPNMQHEIGLAALEAGKHVFMEKPPGEHLEQALDLADAAVRNGVQCQVAFQKRFATAYRLARDVVSRAGFGGVRLCKLNYSHWRQSDWRSHLTMMSVHPLDLVHFFMGDADAAHVLKRTASDGRSTCVLTLQYESGASAVVNMSANDPHVQEWVELSGANQLVAVHNLIEFRHWAEGSEYPQSHRLNEQAVGAWHPEFAIPYQQADSMWLQGYAGEVVEFADALLGGRPVSPSITDGVTTMRYVEAIVDAPDGVTELDLGTQRVGRHVGKRSEGAT